MDQPQRRTTRWPLAVTALMAVLAFGLAASLAVVFTLWGQVGRLQAWVSALRLELTQRELQRLGETPMPPVTTTEIPDQPVLSDRVIKPVTPDASWPQSQTELIITLRQQLVAAAGKPYALADASGNVRWWSQPVEIPLTGDVTKRLLGPNPDGSQINEPASYDALSQIGEFTAGPYAGRQAVLLYEPAMGEYYTFYARDPASGKGTRLPNYPFDYDDPDERQSGAATTEWVDYAYRFADLDYPQTVPLTPAIQLQRAEYAWGPRVTAANESDLVVPQSIVGDLFYNGDDHAFFVVSPTGHSVPYSSEIPFRSPESDPKESRLSLNWWYGVPTDDYRYATLGGCGATNFRAVETAATPGMLVQAGTTGTGDPIYEFADLGHEELRKQYREWYVPFEQTKPSYEAFLRSHPTFFWRDQLGRLVRFTKSDFIPGVECGKPAIYLYPTQRQAVRVEVDPRGGFTHTEPPYGSGWEVIASPDGMLRDQATGKTYRYLWWDGRGGLYQAPEKYWVVAQADVEEFLRTTLPKLGLNGNESADFLEYWLPYFSAEHPYYRIGFHSTSVMDALAPLTITPSPDQVIRILMDYEGLNAPASSNPPRVVTPRRIGFTVIEWGGVRH